MRHKGLPFGATCNSTIGSPTLVTFENLLLLIYKLPDPALRPDIGHWWEGGTQILPSHKLYPLSQLEPFNYLESVSNFKHKNAPYQFLNIIGSYSSTDLH